MRNGTDEMPAVRAAMENLVAREMFCWRTTSRSMSPGSKPAGRRGHRYDLTRARVVRGTHTEGVDACAGVTVVQGGKPPTPGVKPAARTIRDACPGLWLNTVVYARGGFFQDSSPSQRPCLGAGICSYTRSQRLTCTGASTLVHEVAPLWGARPRHNAAPRFQTYPWIQLAFPAPCGSSTSSEEPLATMEKPCMRRGERAAEVAIVSLHGDRDNIMPSFENRIAVR